MLIWMRPVVSVHISDIIAFIALWGISETQMSFNFGVSLITAGWGCCKLDLWVEVFLNCWPPIHNCVRIVLSVYWIHLSPFTPHCFICLLGETCLLPICCSAFRWRATFYIPTHENQHGLVDLSEALLMCGPLKVIPYQLDHMVLSLECMCRFR